MKTMPNIILRGGPDGERLYLRDLKFTMPDGRKIHIKKTNEPGVNMPDLIARARGRYGLLALFSRPGHRLLDLACGVGLAADFLKDFGLIYQGIDYDPIIIEYARRVYGNNKTIFSLGNLCSPDLGKHNYDIIGCIECLEHIEKKYQKPLIDACYNALKPGGALVVSSPENATGTSGAGTNPYHKWELSKKDFLALLRSRFGEGNVDLLTYRAILSCSSTMTTCFFGICRKPV